MHRFYLDLHGLATVDLCVSARMERKIRGNLASLVSAARPAHPDLVVENVSDVRDGIRLLGMVRGSRYQFAWLKVGDRAGLAMMDAARPVAILVPGRPLTLYLDRDARNTGRPYVMLLYAMSLAVSANRALLLHGACLAPGIDAPALMLAGRRGSCKTCLSLSLLHAGWHYLADDKVLLRASRAYPVERDIGILDWHLDQLPWLYDRLPPRVRDGKRGARRALRSLVSRLGARALPDRFTVAWEQAWIRDCRAPVHELFPGCRVLPDAGLRAVVLLRPAAAVELVELPPERAIPRLARIEAAMFADLVPLPAVFEDYFLGARTTWLEDALTSNLSGVSFVELGLPMDGTYATVQAEALACLSTVVKGAA